MRIQFLPEAEAELREAARYYETRAPGIGLTFLTELHKTTLLIGSHPQSGEVVHDTIRKTVLPHFPYSLLYSIEADVLLIVAVAHHKRRPTYWYSRMIRQPT
jgi:plasmid stabilization system protein ParE